MVSHLVLEVVDLVKKDLLLLLFLVFVVVYTLLESELGLGEPCQRIRVLDHEIVEAGNEKGDMLARS